MRRSALQRAIVRAVRAGHVTRATIERHVHAGKAAVDGALRALERAGVLTASKTPKSRRRVTKGKRRAAKKNPAMSAKEGRAFKAQVAQSNAKTLRALARAKVKELRAQVKAARKRGPLRSREVAALVKRARVLLKQGAKAETAADVLRAKRELEVERADQRTQTRLERANKKAAKERPKYASARERASESDGTVEGNLPPEFVPLWHRVKRSIKGNERKSRTEAFLEYVAENPGEVIDAQDGSTDAQIAELEKRANSVQAFARKRSYSAAEYAAPPF